MKKFALLLSLCLTFPVIAQPEKFTALWGLDNQQGETHLFYRHYKDTIPLPNYYWVSEIHHLDVKNNINLLILTDYSRYNGFGTEIKYTTSIDFFNNHPGHYIYFSFEQDEEGYSFCYITRFDVGEVIFDFDHSDKIKISRQDSSLVYASKPPYYSPQEFLLKSTDAGYSWDYIAGNIPFLYIVSFSPFDDQVLFGASWDYHLYKSTDGGANFALIDSSETWNWQAYGLRKSLDLFFDADSMHLYTLLLSIEGQYRLLRSDDNGEHWQELLSDSTEMIIRPDPLIPGQLYLSRGKQILTSDDFGDTFSPYWMLNDPVVGMYKKPASDILYAATNFDIYQVTPTDTVSLLHLPIVGIGVLPEPVSMGFHLFQNYPNPFNPTTNIGFRILDFGFVSLKVYDLLGKEIAILVNKKLPPGEYEVQWDGRDDAGKEVASGLYIYRLQAEGFTQSRKMLLLR